MLTMKERVAVTRETENASNYETRISEDSL